MNSAKMKKRQLKSKRKKLKQQSRHKRIKPNNTRPKLWSVPIPEHNLPVIDNKVRLYHFTDNFKLDSILKHGLIKGDIYGGRTKDHFLIQNYNGVNLTSENEFHNPANKPVSFTTKENTYLRLEVYFDADDTNIISFSWFDKVYFNNTNRDLIAECNAKGNNNGDINKQYLYKGYISPDMIKKVSAWNPKTKYWDRLSKGDIHKLSNPYLGNWVFEYGRVGGWDLIDWSGKLDYLKSETDYTNMFLPVYMLSDALVRRFNKQQLRIFQRNLDTYIAGFKENWTTKMIEYVVKEYNRFFKDEYKEGHEVSFPLLVNLINERQKQLNNDLIEYQKKLEQPESEVA